jgi:glutamate synthase domain-containing protein 1
MCGIVGLFLKNRALEPQLGSLTATMLGTMCERGPDSAGFAVYGSGDAGQIKITVRSSAPDYDFAKLAEAVSHDIEAHVSSETHGNHGIMTVAEDHAAKAEEALQRIGGEEIELFGRGMRMEIYKDIGRPNKVADRFHLEQMSGSHAVGHTRMATESAVNAAGAHPFSTGVDQCLVHNGSLSNYNALRRELQRKGMTFQTKNDTEVASVYLTWKMKEGASLGEALESSLDDLDGFYTFVVGTENGFGVLRDPIACKPAVLAETDDYVAFGSEYRALAALPGIENAKVWEPEPATVYFWERS